MTDYEPLYARITDALVEKGYVVIENALDIELLGKLQRFVLEQKSFKQAGISDANNLHLDASKRRDKTLWIDEDNDVQSEYLSFTEGLKNYLNRSLYLGLSYYESHFAMYDKNDFYEKHVDAFKHSKNRQVTTVYYLNEQWKEEDGGALLMYNEENTLLSNVIPTANTLVVFLSEKFPHEVLPAHKKRYSIAGWYRVDKR